MFYYQSMRRWNAVYNAMNHLFYTLFLWLLFSQSLIMVQSWPWPHPDPPLHGMSWTGKGRSAHCPSLWTKWNPSQCALTHCKGKKRIFHWISIKWFQNLDALITGMVVSSYDFNPFPYCPIWVDSGERLLDFPNWITWVASPNIMFKSHKLAENLWNAWKSDLKCKTFILQSLVQFLWSTYSGPFQFHHRENKACNHPAAQVFFLWAQQQRAHWKQVQAIPVTACDFLRFIPV